MLLLRRSPISTSPTAKKLQSSRTSDAVLILAKPFPVPKVRTVQVEKPPSGRLGLHFYWDGHRGHRVQIKAINDDSPLHNTPLAVGDIVLAINSVATTDALQTTNLIKGSGPKVEITAMSESSELKHPYCRLVAALTSKEHPGVRFDSTRDRCLVQISRVFPHGPFAGTALHQGDVVLAVNGVPVSTPEQAERLLRQGLYQAANSVLYVVDMNDYRQSILQELQVSPTFHDIVLEPDEIQSGKAFNLKFGGEQQTLAQLELDFESQHLVDRNMHLQVGSLSKNGFARAYNHAYEIVVLPFLERHNSGIEQRMQILEEAVCCEVWQHDIADSAGLSSEHTNPTSDRATDADISQREGFNVQHSQMQGSTLPEGVAVEDCDQIPVASALIVCDIDVLPPRVLQSLAERCSDVAPEGRSR